MVPLLHQFQAALSAAATAVNRAIRSAVPAGLYAGVLPASAALPNLDDATAARLFAAPMHISIYDLLYAKIKSPRR